MANVIFYTICLLYVFCAAVVVSDIISVTLKVSNKFICENIHFYHQLRSSISIHYHLNFKLTYSQ